MDICVDRLAHGFESIQQFLFGRVLKATRVNRFSANALGFLNNVHHPLERNCQWFEIRFGLLGFKCRDFCPDIGQYFRPCPQHSRYRVFGIPIIDQYVGDAFLQEGQHVAGGRIQIFGGLVPQQLEVFGYELRHRNFKIPGNDDLDDPYAQAPECIRVSCPAGNQSDAETPAD